MVEQFRNFRSDDLQKILDHAGSWKRFKEMLGIDDKELRRIKTFNPELSLLKLAAENMWNPVSLTDELRRIGSTALFCIIHRCKESELRAKCQEFEIDVKTLCLPIGATSGTGRKGETFFKQVRGEFIKEDCFETRGHTCEFDFLDSVYGLVNVKTAKRQRYTAKTRANDPNYWDFSTKGHKDCDYLALVPLDPNGEPQMVIMAPARDIGKHYSSHIVLTGNELKATSAALSPIHGDGQGGGRMYLLLPAMLKRFERVDGEIVAETPTEVAGDWKLRGV